MLAVESNYYSIQTPLIYKSPVEDLNDFHLAKLVVYLVKLFEKKTSDYSKVKPKVHLVRNSGIHCLKC